MERRWNTPQSFRTKPETHYGMDQDGAIATSGYSSGTNYHRAYALWYGARRYLSMAFPIMASRLYGEGNQAGRAYLFPLFCILGIFYPV
ncbi:MAG: hypothetical protein BROFUL_00424 [Candidatus Brocadia fulgida]|uniref:Uncharacterized protein n=1 Tax=Candidatus Brocadia fulgida TaxID=380242 RepID=A0A0M2V292_9BACT|nr:MAG: hypothetical protein BROFUL_00424 [Candidatus Brocadia fulgida]